MAAYWPWLLGVVTLVLVLPLLWLIWPLLMINQWGYSQIMVGLALFLTVFIMAPVFSRINQAAIKPYLAEEINAEQALQEAVKPVSQRYSKIYQELRPLIARQEPIGWVWLHRQKSTTGSLR